MIKFLRYNGRHSLFFPRGDKGKWMPQLNPIMSFSHNEKGKRTWRLGESLLCMRIRHRLFSFAGNQRCPQRVNTFAGQTDKPLPDSWDIGPDGNRTCSFCGSIHFDDFNKIVELANTDDRYRIEGTTKSYKCYVRQPGVINAGQGAIKFYGWHAK